MQFTSSLRLRRVGYVYDERGNMHVCLEWENSDGSAVEYVVLTTVDENGENIFWRKVPGVDAARSCGRFRMKLLVEKNKQKGAQYLGVRFALCACVDQTQLRDQDPQRLLLNLPDRGD